MAAPVATRMQIKPGREVPAEVGCHAEPCS